MRTKTGILLTLGLIVLLQIFIIYLLAFPMDPSSLNLDFGRNDLLIIGEKMPDFSELAFVDGNITEFSSEDIVSNWTIIFFYPADFSHVCPTELAELAERYDEIRDLGSEVITISTDTAEMHEEWVNSTPMLSGIKYPMLSDPDKDVSRKFGVLSDKTGLAMRSTFIFNPEKEVIAMEINEDNVGRSIAETIRTLEAAQLTYDLEGTMCPAEWNPGDEIINISGDNTQ
ncbi:MAG: peroxiredoxin [Candidatus Woesearchaeota archaeon]